LGTLSDFNVIWIKIFYSWKIKMSAKKWRLEHSKFISFQSWNWITFSKFIPPNQCGETF
jgi:hypothetical protein